MTEQWQNVDQATRSIVKFEITTDHGHSTVEAWGAAHPQLRDLGKTSLVRLGDSTTSKELPYGSAVWYEGWGEVRMSLRRDRDEMVVDLDNIFKDESGRTNFRTNERFRIVNNSSAACSPAE